MTILKHNFRLRYSIPPRSLQSPTLDAGGTATSLLVADWPDQDGIWAGELATDVRDRTLLRLGDSPMTNMEDAMRSMEMPVAADILRLRLRGSELTGLPSSSSD